MERVCGTCGDVGYTDALHTCDQCKISTEHEYCMRDWPERVADKWICEECEARNEAKELTSNPTEAAEKLKPDNPVAKKNDSGVPGGSIQKDTKLQKAKLSWENMVDRGKTKYIPVKEALKMPSVATSSFSKELYPKMSSRFEKTQFKPTAIPPHPPPLDVAKKVSAQRMEPSASSSHAPRQRLVLTDKDARSEVPQKKLTSDSLSLRDGASTPPGSSHFNNEGSSLIANTNPGCAPALNVLWKGTFSVGVEYGQWELDHKLQAHPPCQVLRIIYNLPRKMPEMLRFQAVPSKQRWTELFNDYTPDERDIGLYFFPTESSSDGWYVSFVESISSNMYALRKQVDNIELLVFTSNLLNTKCQRWKGKYYLWGVFNPLKQDTTPPAPTPEPVAGAPPHPQGKPLTR